MNHHNILKFELRKYFRYNPKQKNSTLGFLNRNYQIKQKSHQNKLIKLQSNIIELFQNCRFFEKYNLYIVIAFMLNNSC